MEWYDGNDCQIVILSLTNIKPSGLMSLRAFCLTSMPRSSPSQARMCLIKDRTSYIAED